MSDRLGIISQQLYDSLDTDTQREHYTKMMQQLALHMIAIHRPILSVPGGPIIDDQIEGKIRNPNEDKIEPDDKKEEHKVNIVVNPNDEVRKVYLVDLLAKYFPLTRDHYTAPVRLFCYRYDQRKILNIKYLEDLYLYKENKKKGKWTIETKLSDLQLCHIIRRAIYN
jgi:hypothetical protein